MSRSGGTYGWPTSSSEVLSGIQLLARLIVGQPAFDARHGLDTAVFVSGYEGSPLGGLDLTLQKEAAVRDRRGIVHVPGVNEELAATSVWGSQTVPRPDGRHDGVVGVWYGKAPGLDRAGDAMRHGNFVGSSPTGGVVALVGDDPAAKSSTLPSASEMALAELCMPVLYPGSPQELCDLFRHAVALSRFSGLWVGLKVATDVADGLGVVDLGTDHPSVVLPEIEADGERWRHRQHLVTLPPDSLVSEGDLFHHRLRAAEAYVAANAINGVTSDGGARIGVVAGGTVHQALVQALTQAGVRADLEGSGLRLLRLGALFPLAAEQVRSFAQGLDRIVVLEEKRSFVEAAIRDCLYGEEHRPDVVGKKDRDGRPLVPPDGELTVERIGEVLARAAGIGRRRIPLAVAAAGHGSTQNGSGGGSGRVPYFCSGCPHNRSTLVPDGSIIGAGIGCHTMVLLTDEENRKALALTQMGGEGAQWIGQSAFSRADHMFQNLGDGTLFHSGSLAIRACVAAGVNITYKILYNRAVAMTGGQSPAGQHEVPELTRLLEAEGVVRTIVCADDPRKYPSGSRWAKDVKVYERDQLMRAQEELQSVPGVTVLIYDQQCAAEARRRRHRGLQAAPEQRVVINQRVCEGCGDCGVKSNCLSVHPVETEYGTKRMIHQASCNQDFTCLEGDCPSFVTVRPARRVLRRRRRAGATTAHPVPVLTGDEIPEPLQKASAAGGYSIFLTGIGGTGIVTVNAFLALAANTDGIDVAGLDQTGLSQKAGPVVSHLKLAPMGGSRRVSAGGTDCWLVFDAMVAADPRHLAMAAPERTAAVVSTSPTPTGAMVRHPDLAYPELADLLERLESVTRPEANTYLDAMDLSQRLLGDQIGANVLLLGAAYQKGLIPLRAQALEKAIEDHGVAVEMNLAAFRWGRALVAWPERPLPDRPAPSASLRRGESQARALVAARLGAELAEDDDRYGLIVRRVRELLAYQGPKVADPYLATVGRALAAERGLGRREFSAAVVEGLYKLSAYKDEYEVARLYLDPEFEASWRAEFPEGGRISYHLHPPLLRQLGRRHKISFGPWFRVVFRILYALRFLRGSIADPFGHTRVRRTERALVREYATAVEQAAARLDDESYPRAVALARLPELVRGYEEIKLAGVEAFRSELARLQQPEVVPARATMAG